MARDLKDEQQLPQSEEEVPAPFQQDPALLQGQGSFLITPSASLQRTAVEMVIADFDAAKSARDTREYGWSAKGDKLNFDTWLTELKRLYYGHREPKTIPWKFCSNRSLMIAMAILETLHARLFPAVYNEDLTRWRPTEYVDEEKTERVTKFMFWWIRVRIKMREFFDRWVRSCLGFGSVLTTTSWDIHVRDKGRLTPPQLTLLPDGSLQVVPSQKELERHETSRSDIIPIEDVFLQPGATDLQRDTVIVKRHYPYRELEDMEREGKLVNVSVPSEPNILTLKSHLVVPEPVGNDLTSDQIEELKDVKRRNTPVECVEWWSGLDLDGDKFPEQVRLLVNPEYRIYLGGVELKNLSARGLRPLDLTMFMPRLDEPQGLMGMGVLEQVKELAMEIDAIFNQMTDGNTLSVMRPGFYDPSGDVDAPALNLAPNRLTPVSNPSQSVFFPDINIPTERLILAIRLVLEFLERLTGASAYIFGKESEIVGGSGTATRTQEIVQASAQRHSIPAQRLREGAARIMSQHLDLIQKRAQDGDRFIEALSSRVLGDDGHPVFEPNELSQEGISGEYDAYLLPDESMGSRDTERLLTSNLYTLLLQNIIVASDPAKLYTVTADLLKAWGKNPEHYLGPEPEINQSKSPEEENTLMLQGDFSIVKATVLDNPLHHLMVHGQLLQDPAFQALPTDQQQMISMFLQSHQSQHLQMLQLTLQASTKQKGGQNAPGRNGTPGRTTPAAAPVGPESGVGTPSPAAGAVGATQRVGESQPAQG